MSHLIPRIEFPEIVIGLVAPIGTPLGPTITALSDQFRSLGYDVRQIKVTDIYKMLAGYIKPKIPLVESPLVDRYRSYIAFGNQVREAMDDSSVLSALTVYRIVGTRLRGAKEDENKFSKTVYILDQFKRQEEIDLLRAVYGRIFSKCPCTLGDRLVLIICLGNLQKTQAILTMIIFAQTPSA